MFKYRPIKCIIINSYSLNHSLGVFAAKNCKNCGQKLWLKIAIICSFRLGRRGGRADCSLGIQCSDRGFEFQWQWVKSAIITEAVFCSFLIMSRWFPQGTPVFSTKKKAAEVKFKIGNFMRGRLSAHLLSLHNRAGVAGSRSALTCHRLKYKALVKFRHLFIYFLYLFA